MHYKLDIYKIAVCSLVCLIFSSRIWCPEAETSATEISPLLRITHHSNNSSEEREQNLESCEGLCREAGLCEGIRYAAACLLVVGGVTALSLCAIRNGCTL